MEVKYPWLPSKCGGCGDFGHPAYRCPKLSPQLGDKNKHQRSLSKSKRSRGRSRSRPKGQPKATFLEKGKVKSTHEEPVGSMAHDLLALIKDISSKDEGTSKGVELDVFKGSQSLSVEADGNFDVQKEVFLVPPVSAVAVTMTLAETLESSLLRSPQPQVCSGTTSISGHAPEPITYFGSTKDLLEKEDEPPFIMVSRKNSSRKAAGLN